VSLNYFLTLKSIVMPETILQQEASLTQQNMLAYFETHDVKYIAEDAVFRNLGTGEQHKGRAEVGAMLHYIYHVAFDAHAEFSSYIITEDKAVVEGLFIGKHIGDLNGIPPTGRQVSVPICITYYLKDSLIQEAHIYMLSDVLLQQLGVTQNASRQKVTYLVRDIFQLKFGHYRDVKVLFEEAREKQMIPDHSMRVYTDFTGNAYRLILEEGFDSLADYELAMNSSLKTAEWQSWYERFKPHVEGSHREILKQII
jgi:predicted ester cyclase